MTENATTPDDVSSSATSSADARDATAPAGPGTGAPGTETWAGYVMVHHDDATHQVHAMLSDGDDPTTWRALDGGAGILTSTLGEGGLRDPHLVRSADGSRFYLLATDLDIRVTERPGLTGSFWDWIGRHGSRSINVWESADLMTWGPQRQVELSPPTAGMAWAPKTVWDEATESFLVLWSARVYADDDPQHTGPGEHRLLGARTADFVTFTEAVDHGHPTRSVIDALVVPDGDGYVRFVKDEAAGIVFSERSDDLDAPVWEQVSESVTAGTETGIVEGPLAFRSFTDGEWYLWVDEYTGPDRGYVPFHASSLTVERWEPVEGYVFPGKIKHGTVLPVTAAEYAQLSRRV